MPELVFFSGTMDCGKSTLALQIEHNRSARGLAGMIFTRDDRAGEGKLSSRLGLVTDAVEVEDGQDLYGYLVDHLSQGGRADYVIADEAQFLAPEQIDQLARVVDDLGLDVYEDESELFFEDHSDLPLQDDTLARLLSFPNVIVTAHQAFLTHEALDAIARTTLDNIAAWLAGRPINEVKAGA